MIFPSAGELKQKNTAKDKLQQKFVQNMILRAVEHCRPTHMTASSIIVALADQIFNRSYVNRQHFLLRSFASLCLDRLSYIDECYFGTGNKNRKQRHMLDGRLF